jgi:hypothetical protein
MDEVYYRIYYLDREDYITIVCMQDFDEYDYHQHHFYTNPDTGEKYKFDNEEEAIQFLNSNFQKEYIDPEYWRGDHIFGHMLKK